MYLRLIMWERMNGINRGISEIAMGTCHNPREPCARRRVARGSLGIPPKSGACAHVFIYLYLHFRHLYMSIVHTFLHFYVHLHVRTCPRCVIYTCIHACIYIYIYLYGPTCTRRCIHTCVFTCLHLCIYIYIHARRRWCISTFLHLHIYTFMLMYFAAFL